ncbi:cytochrome P450 [Cladochytrium replicatum]|nr:cytochrome P450 [Cladochytrium replicatum]
MLSAILFSLLAAVVSLAVFGFLSLRSRQFRRLVVGNFASASFLLHPTLPGPPVLPFVGFLFSMLDSMETGESHIDGHAELTRYSRDGVLLIQTTINGKLAVVTGDAELMKYILTKGYRPKRLQSFGMDMLKYGLFVMPTSDVWRAHRKGIQPGFGPSHLRHAFKVTNDLAKLLVQGISTKLVTAKKDGKPLILDMHKLLSCLTLDVLAQVAFSSDFGALAHMLEHGENVPAITYLGQIFSIIQKRVAVPKVLWKYAGIAESNTEELRENVHGYVQNLLSDRINSAKRTTGDERYWELDVMDRLLAKDEEGKSRFSNAEIVDELVAFMLAGQDTTANTMSWYLMEHARNPELAEDVEAEVDSLFSALCSDDRLTLSDTNFDTILGESPKFDMFFKEVQRFHPVVTGIVRELHEDKVTLAGHTVNASDGTLFFVRIRSLHFNEAHWKDPERFDPSRWTEPPVPGAFLPFADGPHNCIGKKMAVIEAMTALAVLVHHFRFKLIPGQHLRGKTALTTGPRDGLFFEIESR